MNGLDAIDEDSTPNPAAEAPSPADPIATLKGGQAKETVICFRKGDSAQYYQNFDTVMRDTKERLAARNMECRQVFFTKAMATTGLVCTRVHRSGAEREEFEKKFHVVYIGAKGSRSG